MHSKDLHKHPSTVKLTLVATLLRSGHPAKITPRTQCAILKEVQTNLQRFLQLAKNPILSHKRPPGCLTAVMERCSLD